MIHYYTTSGLGEMGYCILWKMASILKRFWNAVSLKSLGRFINKYNKNRKKEFRDLIQLFFYLVGFPRPQSYGSIDVYILRHLKLKTTSFCYALRTSYFDKFVL